MPCAKDNGAESLGLCGSPLHVYIAVVAPEYKLDVITTDELESD
jgi:hypothetical protein